MVSYKLYLVLSAWILFVAADYEFERFKNIHFHGDHDLSDSWPHDFHERSFSASESIPHYSLKKVPTEFKKLKKGVMPFYTLTGKDDPKFKEMVLKSGAPFCQEIKKKRSTDDKEKSTAKETVICYSCKDPKKGSVFEHCSYKSKPETRASETDSPRYRRSQFNDNRGEASETSSKGEQPPKDLYHFSDEFFSAATDEIPAEYKKHAEHCDKIVKDSMVCMVCKDPKTNGKYEQCSYVSQPKQKEYAYSKSSSFGKPEKESKSYEPKSYESKSYEPKSYEPKSYESKSYEPKSYEPKSTEVQERNDYKTPSSDESYDSYPTNHKYQSKRYGEEPEQFSKEAEESVDCKKVEKGTETCMVCKDPKTGGNYEKCSYNYQPNDKVYKFSRSKSFGYPESSKESKSPEKYTDKSAEAPKEEPHDSAEFIADYSVPSSTKYYKFDVDHADKASGSKQSKPDKEDDEDSSKYSESRSESQEDDEGPAKYSESKSTPYSDGPSYSYSKGKPYETKEGGGGGGGSSKYSTREPKSYESDPSKYETSATKYYKDEIPKYLASADKSSSSSEESPSKYTSEEPSSYGGDYSLPKFSDTSKFFDASPSTEYVKSESERIAENIDASNCQKIQKESMTCTVCKDPKTGGNSEQCFYSYQPDDKLFSYSKSKSYGSPTGSGSGSGSGSESESKEEPGQGKESSSSSSVPYSTPYPYKYSESKPYATSETREAGNYESAEVLPTTEAAAAAAAQKKSDDVIDLGYFDTSSKKAEIEKFLQEFQNEDRTNCKKVLRDKMTCYQCVDETGFQKEECVFVAEQEPEKNRLTYREVKEFETEPTEAPSVKQSKKQKPRRRVEVEPLEPTASASDRVYVKREKPSESPDGEQEEGGEKTEQDEKEAEAYDYALETRPRYDKVLGMTLPEYMLTISEHEAAFDEAVAADRSK